MAQHQTTSQPTVSASTSQAGAQGNPAPSPSPELGGFKVGHHATVGFTQAVGTIVAVREQAGGPVVVVVEFADPQPVDGPAGATATRFELDWRNIKSTWAAPDTQAKPQKRYFDRHGSPLELGQTVTVQHCVGRYGRTEQLTGKLVSIGIYGNVSLDTGKPGQGNCVYPGFTPDVSLGPGALRGFDRHVDFEHGHEKWIELVAEPASEASDSQQP
jgi:hypothetical protein